MLCVMTEVCCCCEREKPNHPEHVSTGVRLRCALSQRNAAPMAKRQGRVGLHRKRHPARCERTLLCTHCFARTALRALIAHKGADCMHASGGGAGSLAQQRLQVRQRRLRTCTVSAPRLTVPATTVPTPGTPNVSSMTNSTGSCRLSAHRCRCGVKLMKSRSRSSPWPVTAEVRKIGARDSEVIARAHVTTSCMHAMHVCGCSAAGPVAALQRLGWSACGGGMAAGVRGAADTRVAHVSGAAFAPTAHVMRAHCCCCICTHCTLDEGTWAAAHLYCVDDEWALPDARALQDSYQLLETLLEDMLWADVNLGDDKKRGHLQR
jgi:hypothetical protein